MPQNDKTGEGNYRFPTYSLGQVALNGDEGIFYYRDKNAKKDEKTNKYPTDAITEKSEPLEIVFLKIRRRLSVFKKGGEGYSTNEHNHKKELVVLYGKGKQVGTAEDLREQYPELRTQQIVYSYLPSKKEVVRVLFKGSVLGSDETPKGVLKFYEYLQSFSAEEHSHEFITILQPIEEQGPKGIYYSISFVRGRKLEEKELEKMNTLIDEVHEKVAAIDASMAARIGAKATEPEKRDEEAVKESAKSVGADEEADDGYPREDISPDDIPF